MTDQRWHTHHDTMDKVNGQWTHARGSCIDPDHCDCICPHCMTKRMWDKVKKGLTSGNS